MQTVDELNFQSTLHHAAHLPGGRFSALRNATRAADTAWATPAWLWRMLCVGVRRVLSQSKSSARMHLVERMTLAPRHQVLLVDIDGERCLLTIAPHAGIGFHLLDGVARGLNEPLTKDRQ